MPIRPPQAIEGLRDVAGLGLAVSGGGDSMAMLYLAHACGLRPQVATVDHGLRAESAAEARMVADVCAQLGLTHSILIWQGWDRRGNLQDHARRARRALLADWARGRGLSAVALAHTADDQAETLIMRLARGAGVDGLSAMQRQWREGGIQFLRPFLATTRADLRADLARFGGIWVEDPSNDLDRFERVRARKALGLLAPLGIDAARLGQVAAQMSGARAALDAGTDALIRAHVQGRAGILSLDPQFLTGPPELQRRLIQRVILWLNPADYPPRGAAISGLLARLPAPAQLAGCHFRPDHGKILAFREGKSLPRHPATSLWDRLWQVENPDPACDLAPLGAAGLAQWTDWRSTQMPRAALLSQPSLWRGERLLATPLWPQSPIKAAFFRRHCDNTLDDLNLSH